MARAGGSFGFLPAPALGTESNSFCAVSKTAEEATPVRSHDGAHQEGEGEGSEALKQVYSSTANGTFSKQWQAPRGSRPEGPHERDDPLLRRLMPSGHGFVLVRLPLTVFLQFCARLGQRTLLRGAREARLLQHVRCPTACAAVSLGTTYESKSDSTTSERIPGPG